MSTLKQIINSRTTYKISVSILFGLAGFYANFHTLLFPIGEYTAAILIGLLFPALITFSWGWKYGLLSALAGGCQTMWWIWGPSNGYATFFVVVPFTLWIVWHGIFADLRRKQKTPKWWQNMYVVEIPFRILNTINLYTLTRWAITFNPPPWKWALNAADTTPMHFSNFVVIKQAVVGFIILLLIDVLLNFKNVRRFFKLKIEFRNFKPENIISAYLLMGVAFWMFDSVFCYLSANTESSLLDLLALNIPSHNVFVRCVFIIGCLIAGLITSKILYKQYKSEERFQLIVQNMPVLINAMDEKGTYLFWNRECEKVTGYSANEITGKPNIPELLYPDKTYLQNLMKKWNKMGNNFSNWEMTLTDKNASPKTISWSNISDSFPVPGWKSWSIGIDITKQKTAEQKLIKEQEFSNTLIQASPIFFVVIDANGKTIMMNDSMLKALGYTIDEVKDKDYLRTFVPKENHKLLFKVFKGLIQNHKGQLNENQILKKDGEMLLIEWHGRPILDEQGNLDYFFGAGINITERRKAEQELAKHREHLEELIKERTQELEDKNKKLEEFNDLFVNREFRIKELKDRVKDLEKKNE
ncbi:MAG: PAS domain S-box protein [Bacteroidales bacterium]|nr:PAS domain S-box protein [Bacteroidales bacterium]